METSDICGLRVRCPIHLLTLISEEHSSATLCRPLLFTFCPRSLKLVIFSNEGKKKNPLVSFNIIMKWMLLCQGLREKESI